LSDVNAQERRHESCLVHNNKHGFRGVEWDRARQMYRARIEPANGNRGRWLGRYPTAEEAAVAYDEAARLVYGRDARLNFPGPGEVATIPSRRSEGFCRRGHELALHARPRRDGRGAECRLCNNEASLRRYYKRKSQASLSA